MNGLGGFEATKCVGESIVLIKIIDPRLLCNLQNLFISEIRHKCGMPTHTNRNQN